jgi:hypothetical protein
MHSCAVSSNSMSSRGRESRVTGGVCGKEKWVFWVPVVRGNPASSAPGQRLEGNKESEVKACPFPLPFQMGSLSPR